MSNPSDTPQQNTLNGGIFNSFTGKPADNSLQNTIPKQPYRFPEAFKHPYASVQNNKKKNYSQFKGNDNEDINTKKPKFSFGPYNKEKIKQYESSFKEQDSVWDSLQVEPDFDLSDISHEELQLLQKQGEFLTYKLATMPDIINSEIQRQVRFQNYLHTINASFGVYERNMTRMLRIAKLSKKKTAESDEGNPAKEASSQKAKRNAESEPKHNSPAKRARKNVDNKK